MTQLEGTIARFEPSPTFKHGMGLGISMLRLLVSLMECCRVQADPPCGPAWAKFPSPVVTTFILLFVAFLAWTGEMYSWITRVHPTLSPTT